jgi:hypothetical protein
VQKLKKEKLLALEPSDLANKEIDEYATADIPDVYIY